jgi:hypothetical protein
MNIDQSKIEEAVIKETVETLVDNYCHGSDKGEDLRCEIRKQAHELIKKHIDEQVQAALVAGVNALVFPMTNSYGEKKQPDKTLREYIDSCIQTFLQEQVDSDGKTRDLGYGSNSECRIVWLVRQEIKKHVEASVLSAANAIKSQITGVLADIIKKDIGDTIAKMTR